MHPQTQPPKHLTPLANFSLIEQKYGTTELSLELLAAAKTYGSSSPNKAHLPTVKIMHNKKKRYHNFLT